MRVPVFVMPVFVMLVFVMVVFVGALARPDRQRDMPVRTVMMMRVSPGAVPMRERPVHAYRIRARAAIANTRSVVLLE